MGTSAIAALREIIIEVVRFTAQGEWKVLVLDEQSRKLVNGVVKEDDILQENVTNIEQLESRRNGDRGVDAIYLLSPEPHVVDCLIDDFERRRYRRAFLVWTSLLNPEQRDRVERLPIAREQIAHSRVLNIDFFPKESHLVTFRDPHSFPMLFHPACNQLVRKHMDILAQKIVSVCVSLGEYPTIRYYRPRNPTHEASVLCSHLARFVQEGLDQHAKYHEAFPPPSPRARGVLLITDRTMDLFAPLVHEFTYQAMAHDLLPIKDGEKTSFKTIVNRGGPNEEEKEMELSEKDKIWVDNRHLHMKDLLEKLVADFNKFRSENPQFAEKSDESNSLNNIKDMLAGLPQFQEGKEAYSLHLNMAQECVDIFKNHGLLDISSVEQSLATGLDDDYKRPKNLADQLVRLLDDEHISFPDRLRLIIEYIIYRDGVFPTDIEKLLAHASLPTRDSEVIQNLDLLGARITRPIKDTKPAPQPLFPRKQAPPPGTEDLSLSRYDPIVKSMIEEHIHGTLDHALFPFTKPLLDANDSLPGQVNISQASLRSAKPTWARTRPSALEPRQRVIVFMAGGATYSEARICYEISRTFSKDVYLATSHMLTPTLFLRQVRDLSVDRRQLDLPMDRPSPRPPAHIFEKDPPLKATLQPPTAGLGAMNLGAQQGGSARQLPANGLPARPNAGKPHPIPSPTFQGTPGKLTKEKEKEKKRHFFKF